MNKAMKLFAILFTLGVSLQTQAVNSERELQAYATAAQSFLCGRGFCLQRVPPLDLREVDGYLGYVDGNFSRISISPNLNEADTQLALVHELTHVYRGQQNASEETWLNEGLAKFIEYRYSTVWPVSYMTKLETERLLNFADYQPGGNGYMSSFFLVLYLYNHFGEEKLFQKLMNSKKSGWNNVVSAIQELIDDGSLRIPRELICKESILRHFAVALWMNDKFSAEYALFYLDVKYEPLNAKAATPVRAAVAAPSKVDGMQIRFFTRSSYRTTSRSKEEYSILSYSPFQIKAFEPSDRPAIIISILR
jgi:hypothetical protein